jgi:hypothetical protein
MYINAASPSEAFDESSGVYYQLSTVGTLWDFNSAGGHGEIAKLGGTLTLTRGERGFVVLHSTLSGVEANEQSPLPAGEGEGEGLLDRCSLNGAEALRGGQRE